MQAAQPAPNATEHPRMPRHLPTLVQALLVLAIVVGSHKARAEKTPAAFAPGAAASGQLKPHWGELIEQPHPSGMPVERVRLNAAAKLAAGTLALVCPNRQVSCESRAGAFLALTLLHRAESWFAWGGSFEGLTATQVWGDQGQNLTLTHHVLSARLMAELHPLSGYLIDPYFGLGLGGAFIDTRAQATGVDGPRNESHASPTAATGTPFYAARFGFDLELTTRLSVGAVADWSNLLALTGENCPWKTFGACSSNGWGAFPADNAVWKIGAEVSVAFGQEL